jgi:hypothetical protein
VLPPKIDRPIDGPIHGPVADRQTDRPVPVQLRRAWPLGLLAVLLLGSCYPNPNDLRNNGPACTNPTYPKSCPSLGTVPAGCWGSDTACSTVTSCNGDPVACKSSDLKVYCASDKCCKPQPVGGTCALPDCGCSTGQVCYPESSTTGMACYPTMNYSEGADCSALNAFSYCASGLGCFGNVCKKYCLVNSDCPKIDGVQSCSQTIWQDTRQNISGVLVCDRICDPATPQTPRSPLLSCPAGFSCQINTSATTPGVTYCWKSTGAGVAKSACTEDADCSPGYYCATSNVCFKYCFSTTDCPSGSTCQLFSNPTYYAGSKPVGGCTQ